MLLDAYPHTVRYPRATRDASRESKTIRFQPIDHFLCHVFGCRVTNHEYVDIAKNELEARFAASMSATDMTSCLTRRNSSALRFSSLSA